ncbi:MAG: hypothetical protein FJY10_11915, partial [Bacteroidetes bacterium]|nr:hypothetical protein [Bacteroidota bacterium]
MRTVFLSILCVCFSILSVTGQWSNDPALNAKIFGNNQPEYALPKIAADASGGFYISTFRATSAPKNFLVSLQRTDLNGNLLLPSGGVLVTDGPFRTWISDYKLISDADTCAIITYESMEEGPSASQVYAHRFSSTGQALWGSSGVKLTQSSLMKYSPNAILLAEREYIMAWSEYFIDTSKSLIAMHKVDADGSLPWEHPVVLINEDSTFQCPSLLSLHDGNFIVAWFRQVKTGAQIGQEFMRYIFAQKFDKAGYPLWPEPIQICNLDTLAYTIPREITILPMVDDGAGGFFIAWYDSRTDRMNPNVYIQYVDQEGQIKWKTNGIPAIE